MKNVYIVSAKRTPLGSFGGSLSSVPAVKLGAIAVKGALEAANIPADAVQEIFMGHVVQANTGQAPARQVALESGLSNTTPATTINKVCASGMKAIMLGAQSIQLEQNDIVVAGGMENMSSIPFYMGKARYGYGYGNAELTDGLVRDGLQNVYDGQPMGCFADATASQGDISRAAQDDYAILSYRRSAEAWESGFMAKQVVGVDIKDRKGNVNTINHDEEYKNVMYDKIPNLKPVFTKDGTVTAANASTINDGAAALVLASDQSLVDHNLTPLAKVVAYADAAHAPEWFTTAPVLAADKALKRAGLTIADIDYFEVNEAFAVVALSFIKHYDLPIDRVNIYGGAVSLGHPLGCSGARIVTNLTHILKDKKAKYGLAAICNGGGGASAIIIENI